MVQSHVQIAIQKETYKQVSELKDQLNLEISKEVAKIQNQNIREQISIYLKENKKELLIVVIEILETTLLKKRIWRFFRNVLVNILKSIKLN